MLKFISICSLNLLFANLSLFGGNPLLPETLQNKEKPKICFTENKGQVYDQNYKPRPDVLYGAMAGNMAVHIKNNGVSYQLYRVDKYKEVEDPKTKEKRQEIDQQSIYRVDLTWVNANKNFTNSEDEALPGYNNYYLESCPNGALNVKSYKGITLNNLYPGINLHYYEKNGELKHDYIVAPQANYKQIQIKVEGAEIFVNKDGSLFITTPIGKIQEGAPLVYQNGKQLKARWKLKNNTLSFEIENYDPNYELIIDPVTRLWGTYYGGMGDERGLSCSTEASGNVFFAGYTSLNTGTVIATAGSHQTTFGGGGGWDAYLVKFNNVGQRQWGTYYGGSGNEHGNSCTTDVLGNVFLAGRTDGGAVNVIATSGSHQSSLGGVSGGDAFLVKFNSAGLRLWGTYYGGASYDVAHSCCTDISGNVYLTGETSSNTGTMIATVGSHQPTIGGGFDAFLVKFNSAGLRQWGTYYGGFGDEAGYSCNTDTSGNLYVTGYTDSNTGTVIATSGCHQSTNGGGDDGFLVKFNSAGQRQWSTYYGGVGTDYGTNCTTDASGNIYMAGNTISMTTTMIATAGAHQSFNGGANDAFLVKFNNGGQRQWGTYYGGTGDEVASSCSADAVGNVYLAGGTNSATGTVIATSVSHQSSLGGLTDAFLVKFNTGGQRQWGTYYGGTLWEDGHSCYTDTSGNIYLAGSTYSNTGSVIATIGSHQFAFGGGTWDAFLAKFRECDMLNPIIAGTSSVCSGANISLSVSISSTVNPSYSWIGPNSFTAAIQNININNVNMLNVGIYTVVVNNFGCIETATTLVASAEPTITINSGSICAGDTFTLFPSGASTYTVTGGSFTVNPVTQTTYSITGTSANGCVSGNTAVATITVIALPTISVNSGSICSGDTFSISAFGANTYSISGGSFFVNPTLSTSYSISGTSTAGCVSTSAAISNVTVYPNPILSVNSGSICFGNNYTISPSGANTFTITGGTFIVNPNFTTSYSITGTSSAGCVSATAAICNVSVYPNPSVTVNSGSICSGNNFTITPTGANSYTITGGSFIVNPAITSSYSVSGTSSEGCTSTSAAISNVTVHPLPTITASSTSSILCEGESATITASGASTYTYNPGGTGASIVVTPPVTSVYTVSGTNANGCSNNFIFTQNVDACVGISENSGIHPYYIKIYPNPNNGQFSVESDTEAQGLIIDLQGRIVSNLSLVSGKNQISIEHLENGVYFLEVSHPQGKEVFRIIKQ